MRGEVPLNSSTYAFPVIVTPCIPRWDFCRRRAPASGHSRDRAPRPLTPPGIFFLSASSWLAFAVIALRVLLLTPIPQCVPNRGLI